MLTKQTKIDQITADNFGNIMWREVTEILEDGVQISQKYHRSSCSPGADLTNAPEQVKIIAQATWTPETIKPFTAEVTAAIAEQATERAKVEEATAALVAAQAELAAKQAELAAVKE
jgi:hypothetical protein